MTTLADFLLARIAEDEAEAKGALGEPSYPHYGETAAEECWRMAKEEGCAPGGYRFHRSHDPARVLAECEAKRRIVEKAQRADEAFTHQINPATSAASFALTEVMGYLALPYADHDDYDESWRP